MQNPGMFWFGVAFMLVATIMFLIRHPLERFVHLKWKGVPMNEKSAIYAKAWTDGSLTGVALFGFVGLMFVVGSMFG